ncbi:LLM class flavin-dependent oxidoreductase [Natrinema halophilum]|uniref:LLM class flavin-dependent oxidoreductase n=1 Tax=Natrinema halophilum TaxID=1699371 RepID=UPI001F288611|nr:LLM class flavin-dependent oxidoreductase [Natrinema halophilum]UHQ96213.1 LLM class flavin-dependent oxidoreductase [Natrinema halophilum]
MTENTMHIFSFEANNPLPHHVMGAWRHRNNRTADPTGPQYWRELAQIAEQGKLDGIFLADGFAAYEQYEGSIDPTIKHGIQFPKHDPVHTIPIMSEATENLGLAVTMSTTFYQPYNLARKFATLDHLTEGRIGWNIVTSFHDKEAENLGLDEMVEHDERYEIADEYMEVVNKLWTSWDDDAVTQDYESGQFADPNKVNKINHKGKYFDVPGILPVTPSPQGRPVFLQAGQSDRGREFAAKHAEALFTINRSVEATREFVDDINERAKSYGRKSSDIKKLGGILPIIGETEKEAKEIEKQVKELVSYEAGLTAISGQADHDFSGHDPDMHIKDIEVGGVRGALDVVAEETDSLREAATKFGFGVFIPRLVGTPEQIADKLELYVDEGGLDGFLFAQVFRPGTTFDFVEKVIPILQERSRFRTEYDGNTLRAHLDLD